MIGIDTVLISRIRKSIQSEAFINRVFTVEEQSYCNAKSDCAQSYAGLFCLKEAAVKAVGLGFGCGIMPTDIEVSHNENGAPVLLFHRAAIEAFAPHSVSASISHDGDYAVGIVELLPKHCGK